MKTSDVTDWFSSINNSYSKKKKKKKKELPVFSCPKAGCIKLDHCFGGHYICIYWSALSDPYISGPATPPYTSDWGCGTRG